MQSYELPEMDYESLSPDEADKALKVIYADVGGDPRHPYCNKSHPQNKDFVERVTKLFEIKADGDTRTPAQRDIDTICQGALEQQQEKQNRLVEEATKEAELLEGLGFDATSIPENVQPFQVAALKMQRLHTEKNYEALTPLIEAELRTLKVPAHIEGLFSSFNRATDLDEQLKSDIVEKIIFWIHEANKQKFRPPKAKKDETGEFEIEEME
jgi:hypothetical protein